MADKQFSKDFGARVKFFRNMARISQEQLAEALDCATNTVKYIESGKNNLSFSKLPKLCRVLNIEPYQLFIYDKDVSDANRLHEIIKLLESMSDAQLGIVYKLLLNFSALRPTDVPGPIGKDV